MINLQVEEVIQLHDAIIAEHGGSQGIRDMGLLHSAIEMPKATFLGQLLHPTIFDQAAAYLFHIVKNHPFVDGNKRTGVTSALIFFDINQIVLKYDEYLLEELVVATAAGKTTKEQISLFFKNSQ